MTFKQGYEAIKAAETLGLTLSKHADPIEDARDGLTPDEAREIASEDPELIYLRPLGQAIPADQQKVIDDILGV